MRGTESFFIDDSYWSQSDIHNAKLQALHCACRNFRKCSGLRTKSGLNS